jgi:hypothetical protein
MGWLLPHLAGVLVDAVEYTLTRLRIMVVPKATAARCSSCSGLSSRVHSHYQRTLADLSIGGRMVEIGLRSRRWFCRNDACPARAFAEQIEGLTVRYGRRTPPLRCCLEAIGLALAGRAGARLTAVLGVSASRSSLLRLIRALPDPPTRPMPVVGIDDFATRRRHATAPRSSTWTATGR